MIRAVLLIATECRDRHTPAAKPGRRNIGHNTITSLGEVDLGDEVLEVGTSPGGNLPVESKPMPQYLPRRRLSMFTLEDKRFRRLDSVPPSARLQTEAVLICW